MIECYQSLRRVVRMIHLSSHPQSRAPFRFLARRSSARAREVCAKGRGLLYARDRSWHRRLVGLWLFSPRVPHCLCHPDIVHPCLAIMASVHWDSLARLLSLADHLSSRQPNRRCLMLRATVTERASTRKLKRSLSFDGIHEDQEPFLRDISLIRIIYRTLSEIIIGEVFKLISEKETLPAVIIFYWIIFFSYLNLSPRTILDEYLH